MRRQNPAYRGTAIFSENQSPEGRRNALFMGKLNIWLNGLSFRLKEAKTARVDKHPQSLEPNPEKGRGRAVTKEAER